MVFALNSPSVFRGGPLLISGISQGKLGHSCSFINSIGATKFYTDFPGVEDKMLPIVKRRWNGCLAVSRWQ